MRLIDADALQARIMMDAPDFMDGGSSITKAFIMAMIGTKSVTPTIDAVPIQKYDELKEKYDALLKEQEPLEPYACEGDMKCGNGCEIVGYIRESDGKIERLANYCPYCGRPVKWD